jgi:hypothetical protein
MANMDNLRKMQGDVETEAEAEKQVNKDEMMKTYGSVSSAH